MFKLMKNKILYNNENIQYVPHIYTGNKNLWRASVWRKVKGMWTKRKKEPIKELNKMRKEWVKKT